ncbi:uncharacterized protein F4807DRAFT_414548 [Annulohypoxylon truncatum]|uniref:uncharacterized protein n=1 Tax=Annulohypoxylon truncatum TaxID=327061 RepID=UPI0020078829|nr:uncharacterized protein F4807DRAFT_414548 [Annulohypoxylon truncatum]KAI1212803.1 hypothetical protein F4807DRAFT_414548 [Annulohypoxylon truncatum]
MLPVMTLAGVLCSTYSACSTSTKSKERNCHYNELLATEVAKRRSAQASLFDKLSTELLVLIFKQLRDVDSRALAGARQLSRRFEAIVTPIRFESIRLNECIISLETEKCFPRVIQSLCWFTRHVEVRSDLDPSATRGLLDRLQRLSSLRWRYVGKHRSGYFSTPSSILSPNHVNSISIKLYIEDLPLHVFDSESHDMDLQAIPTSNLVSLEMVTPILSLMTRLESLKRLLIEACSIETFLHNDRGQGTQFSFEENERLPAFQELSLRSYDWNHSINEVRKHWDFSRLRRLTLIDVPLFPFLDSIPFSQLHQLHTLHCEDFSTHLPDRRPDATRKLYKLILQIRSLHTLKVTCHTNLFPISGLLSHADSLRILSFRDYVGFGDERQRCPTMRIDDLSLLSRRLTHLHTIELDMDVALCEPAMFLRALCDFPRLDTLVLHTQTTLQAYEGPQWNEDPDYDAVMKILSALMSGRRGKSWRSITVNVGGWKPVMVRRISEAWRQQNRRGFFAERCFVLERDADTGEVVVRENVGVDNNSV